MAIYFLFTCLFVFTGCLYGQKGLPPAKSSSKPKRDLPVLAISTQDSLPSNLLMSPGRRNALSPKSEAYKALKSFAVEAQSGDRKNSK